MKSDDARRRSLISLSAGVVSTNPFGMICHMGTNIIYKALMTRTHSSSLLCRVTQPHSVGPPLAAGGGEDGGQPARRRCRPSGDNRGGGDGWRGGRKTHEFLKLGPFRGVITAAWLMVFKVCVFVAKIQMRH